MLWTIRRGSACCSECFLIVAQRAVEGAAQTSDGSAAETSAGSANVSAAEYTTESAAQTAAQTAGDCLKPPLSAGVG